LEVGPPFPFFFLSLALPSRPSSPFPLEVGPVISR